MNRTYVYWGILVAGGLLGMATQLGIVGRIVILSVVFLGVVGLLLWCPMRAER